MPSLAQVLERHWPDYCRKHHARMPAAHRDAVDAILSCHTAERGGGFYYCGACRHYHYTYHGCGHRACPECGHRQSLAWMARQLQRLLPVTYYMVTFTVPESLRMIFRSHQKAMTTVLFRESAATLQDLAAHERHLGGALGMIGVLHTWTRQLIYHPHIHYIVPGLGLAAGGALKSPKQDGFLLPVNVLSARYRSLMRQALKTKHPELHAQIPSKVWRENWIVHCQPVGRGENAMRYLSRYLHKTAISSSRILSDENGYITFQYTESDTGERKPCRLPAEEFIRRFLQHIPPKGLRRVRSFGWLSPAAKARFLVICALLDKLSACAPAPKPEPYIVRCPKCGAEMWLVDKLPRGPP